MLDADSMIDEEPVNSRNLIPDSLLGRLNQEKMSPTFDDDSMKAGNEDTAKKTNSTTLIHHKTGSMFSKQ